MACDISQGFLDLIQQGQYPTIVKTLKLNGIDLSNIADDSCDIVMAYSVLHHIPNYIDILVEFVRVLKPGGILFIDHESSSNVWTSDSVRSAFLQEMTKAVGSRYLKYFKLKNYLLWFIWKFINRMP